MDQFRKAIEAVLAAHGQLERFSSGQRFYARFDMPYYSSLIIRRQGNKITVGHYFYLQSDLIGDPEAEFYYPTWMPLAIIRYLGEKRETFNGVDGSISTIENIPPTAMEYLSTWAGYIWSEGWVDCSTKTCSRWSDKQCPGSPSRRSFQ